MYSNVAFVEMGHHRIRQRPRRLGVGQIFRRHRLLGNQHGHAGAFRLIILAGDIKNIGADNMADFDENIGQSFGVVHFINVLDILFALSRRLGVADIIDIKT